MTAVVTGATSGVGRAVAVALGRTGEPVWLIGRDRGRLTEVAASVEEAGGTARAVGLDLAAPVEVEAFCRTAGSELQSLELLVHAAAVLGPSDGAGGAAVDDLDRHYATNLRAPIQLTRGLQSLLERGQGDVVFVNSTAVRSNPAGTAAYTATKAGLAAFADTFRNEVNERGIRVLSIFLGRTATPMQAALHEAEGRPYVPERLIQPEDVAALVLAVRALPATAEVTDLTVRPRRPR